jgi:hypothetical protein
MNDFSYLELKRLLVNCNNLNESVNLNIFKKIKDKIKSILDDHNDDINGTLPKIIDYINNFVSNILIKKKILNYLISIVLVMGLSLSNIKAVFNDKKVDNLIEWNNIKNDNIQIDTLKINYKIGEYKLSKIEAQKIENFIKNKIKKNTISFNANIYVTISNDLNNNPKNKNFAIDDTPEEKKQGGKLLEKRLDSVNKIISLIKSKIKDDFNDITFNIIVIGIIDDEKYLLIDDIEIINKGSKNINDVILKDDTYDNDDEDYYLPGTEGKNKDISNLSRNYQVVEILKLGGINAKRFDNDEYEKGDKYSKWILNFRKSIKMFLGRLQKAYLEYDIYFDKDAIAVNTVEDAKKGMSNIDKQYVKLNNEKIILSFNDFVNEAYKDSTEIFNKWNFILGKSFPDLNIEQAIKFDDNIETLLHYLEQIYGSSSLDFTYKK